MKKLLLLFSLFQFIGFGQSNVDKLVKQLEELGNFSYNDWKISENLSGNVKFNGDPSAVNFNDSNWKTIGLDEVSRFRFLLA